ncbi:MAG: alanine--tRNA ligase [Coxiella sp. (in: Bacteria)]|nr:MAG: alanine--tRNA ligase [Coxiella sp. (in: g-proteobacteria)]
MKTNDIRAKFLNYFKDHKHTTVPSSSLIPANDPTLLFVNAGMVQFKDTFLGVDKRSYTRATSSQRCVRAGGKHNDLENVGHTARHHTFFEMLGNFSFGDYFKKEAIEFAWNFLTQELGLSAEKLWVSVYKDDKESEAIWLNEMKIDPKRFSRCGEKDNFWSMGDTGPCGPCTEIFYDHGEDIWGGPPGTKNAEGDRYIEIWNIVFMQYNRDVHGKMTPLPNPCVDTGMGLERVAAVLQGVHNNYDIDLFQNLLKVLSMIVDCDDLTNASLRVIVDHIRSTSFLIVDGVTPSNEGRGYVLRRIIRRALRHGYKMGMREPFFYKLVPALCEEMSLAYPELNDHKENIQAVLEQEERQFIRTLAKGLKIYDEAVSGLKGKQIPGETVFQLYDTFGFPPDLTADIARENGLTIDEAGFDKAMQRQREQSQQHQRFKVDQTAYLHLPGETDFVGFESLSEEAQIQALLIDNKPVTKIKAGMTAVVVLDRTPFYAESGGQIGDSGYLEKGGAKMRIKDTQKKGKVVLHWGDVIEGEFNLEDSVRAEVDALRQDIRLNHSATHLMHEALRKVLGKHVTQKGSLVDANRLRFDFAHPNAVTPEQIHEIEQLVNQQIRSNLAVTLEEKSLEDAKETGAMALFGEKYSDTVRVITMGDFSCEICGGTHVERTGDIGFFKIVNETASQAGVRRIEAVTGAAAIKWAEATESQLKMVSSVLRVKPEESGDKLEQLMQQIKTQKREISKLQQKLASGQSSSLTDQMKKVGDINVLAIQLPEVDRDALRNTMDQLKSKLDKAAIVLATVKDNKIILIAGVTKNCTDKVNAGKLLNHVAKQVGGKGGGRPDLAQGGGDDVTKLAAALDSVVAFVETA